MTMSRRHLLIGAAVLALLPGQAFAAATNNGEALLALLPDRKAAARIGEAWIEQEQQRPDAILQSLSQRLGGGDSGKLRDAIAEDFRNGAVVKIEGWQIARTQAELCALAYFAAVGTL
jgi:translation initiation factor IF-1